MKTINHLLPVWLILLLTGFCASSQVIAGIQVVQRQRQLPLLKEKAFNEMLRIEITTDDVTAGTTLREVVISTAGTTDLNDLDSFSLFWCGDHSEINATAIPADISLFGKPAQPAAKLRFQGTVRLAAGKNHLLLGVKLKDHANLLHFADASCEKIVTSRGTLKPAGEEKQIVQRFGVALRQHGDDGVHTFRIPGLATTNAGTLLAIYDARRASARDLQGDIDIGVQRSTDGGNSWKPMQIALDRGEWGGLPQKFNGVSDACILVDKNSDNIFLAGLWMHGVIDPTGRWREGLTADSTVWNHQWRDKGSQPGFGVKETSQFLITRSSDDGQTWSDPENLTRVCKPESWWLWAPAPGNGITLADSTLVFPTQGRDETGEPFSNITFSQDGGKTWTTSRPATTNTTECAVAQLSDGSLMLNIRDNRNHSKTRTNGRSVAVTSDLGQTWTEHPTSRTTLTEPVCMASLFKHEFHQDGQKQTLLLFSNPNSREGRHQMTIKISRDDGKTWPPEYWLLLDEGTGRGYSSLTAVDEQTIGILYESSQADMVFQKISLHEILKEGHTPF